MLEKKAEVISFFGQPVSLHTSHIQIKEDQFTMYNLDRFVFQIKDIIKVSNLCDR